MDAHTAVLHLFEIKIKTPLRNVAFQWQECCFLPSSILGWAGEDTTPGSSAWLMRRMDADQRELYNRCTVDTETAACYAQSLFRKGFLVVGVTFTVQAPDILHEPAQAPGEWHQCGLVVQKKTKEFPCTAVFYEPWGLTGLGEPVNARRARKTRGGITYPTGKVYPDYHGLPPIVQHYATLLQVTKITTLRGDQDAYHDTTCAFKTADFLRDSLCQMRKDGIGLDTILQGQKPLSVAFPGR